MVSYVKILNDPNPDEGMVDALKAEYNALGLGDENNFAGKKPEDYTDRMWNDE